MTEKKKIPRELYKCLAYNKMLLDSCEMKCPINLSREAVEQWAEEYYGEEYLEKQIKIFSCENGKNGIRAWLGEPVKADDYD